MIAIVPLPFSLAQRFNGFTLFQMQHDMELMQKKKDEEKVSFLNLSFDSLKEKVIAVDDLVYVMKTGT